MLKKFEPKFSQGSLFICTKCGQTYDQPDMAEKLKTEIRSDLKAIEGNKKIRVMVGSCLSVCENNQQTFAYYPNQGNIEIYTTDLELAIAKADILNFVKEKLK